MSKLLLKAVEIAFTAHQGQVDKAGEPYFLHPLAVARIVAENGAGEDTLAAALLHDVVEDTHWTFEMLEAEGFSAVTMDALKLLTHNPSVPYLEYIANIKSNSVAVAVKLADLTHNMDRSRLTVITEKDEERFRRYATAKGMLL